MTGLISNFSSDHVVTVAINPASHTADVAVNSGYYELGNLREIAFLIAAGALTNAVVVKVQEAEDSSGTGVVDLAGFTGSYTATDDNKPAVIRVSASDLSDGFTHVRIVVTPTTAAAIMGVIAVQYDAHSYPVTNTLVFDV